MHETESLLFRTYNLKDTNRTTLLREEKEGEINTFTYMIFRFLVNRMIIWFCNDVNFLFIYFSENTFWNFRVMQKIHTATLEIENRM